MQNGSRVEPHGSNILRVSGCCYRACRGWFGDKRLGTIVSLREWRPTQEFSSAAKIDHHAPIGHGHDDLPNPKYDMILT